MPDSILCIVLSQDFILSFFKNFLMIYQEDSVASGSWASIILIEVDFGDTEVRYYIII